MVNWRIKWPEREADHSSPFSADIKNEWSYTSTPPYAFMLHRINSTFTGGYIKICTKMQTLFCCSLILEN
jgi:hypothetical protein